MAGLTAPPWLRAYESAALPLTNRAHPKCFRHPALSQTPVLAQLWFPDQAQQFGVEHGTQRLQNRMYPMEDVRPRRSEMTRQRRFGWAVVATVPSLRLSAAAGWPLTCSPAARAELGRTRS